MRFQPAIKQESRIHVATIHPPTVKVLQTRKITKLGCLSPPLIFKRKFLISGLKNKLLYIPLGYDPRPLKQYFKTANRQATVARQDVVS